MTRTRFSIRHLKMVSKTFSGFTLLLALTTCLAKYEWFDVSDPFRLPDHVIPISYTLKLEPLLDEGQLIGEVAIVVDILRETKRITLHSWGLDIKSAELDTGKDVQLLSISEQFEYQFLHLLSEHVLKPDTYTLKINYVGSLDHELQGFYRIPYHNEYIAVSQLESTNARTVFPCFDEPGIRDAIFVTTLVVPNGYTALSNSEKKKSYDCNGKTCVEFSPTRPMSTYLNAFVVSKFNYSETIFEISGQTIRLRVYSDEPEERREFALSFAYSSLRYLVKYTNVEVGLEKIDFFGAPGSSFKGAMENWGLVIFTSESLHTDPDQPDPSTAGVIAHELAHFWFGNTVAVQYFDDLWLKEGFATFMAHKILKYYSFESSCYGVPDFASDYVDYPKPFLKHTSTPEEIRTLYRVVYSEGSRLLLMIEDGIGEDTFEKAVKLYFEQHSMKAVITQDLIDAFQLVYNSVNMSDVVYSWALQDNYPVLKISSLPDGSLIATQEPLKFTSDHPETPYGFRWTFPVKYRSTDSEYFSYEWFPYYQESIGPFAEGTIFEETFYYPVAYDDVLWKKMSESMTKYSVGKRVTLLNSAFTQFKMNRMHSSTLGHVLSYLYKEEHYEPWEAVAVNAKNVTQHDSSGYVKTILMECLSDLAERKPALAEKLFEEQYLLPIFDKSLDTVY